MAKLENKTREISQMLNNLNKITATPEKKKSSGANMPAKTNSTTEGNKDEEVQIVIQSTSDWWLSRENT